ncbi:hypothetical protein N0V93_003293 [Gnomoniopsis smithogilvyi]|uniref:Centromere protein Scm3 n=1 Tax=Gnomoniopsis smithogilvyi TaxID=1191159 RepID=A0A9W9CZ04_9PEZI|nr:hypothetical protein N0V93_003293 [Gnomoniopsis smithogilvyi]
MMEPATKRQKTAGAQSDTEDDDELFLEPEELNQRRDPSFVLAKGRAKAATQLKSRFEDIFAKYERDFTGIGDEIDLATGEVVVDNGHLSSMRSMKDWIVDDDQDEDGEGDEDEHDQVEGEAEAEADAEETVRSSPGDVDERRPDSTNGYPQDPWQIAEPSWPVQFASREPLLLESIFPAQSHPKIQDQSYPHLTNGTSMSADPTWQAPELPPSAFLSKKLGPNGRHYGGTMPVVTRTVLRKSLKAPNSPEADNEDDLQTASGSAPGTKENGGSLNIRESPLIHKKFPAVDSSPHDNGLKDLIQDVIANIPDTPPSIRRSRLSKSQGNPSPLNHEHRMHSKVESKLRISNTLHDGGNTKLPKKRGRRPKFHVDPANEGTAQIALRDQDDQSPWEESDLESFLDVTVHGITKPAGQTLYVDIRSNRPNGEDVVTAEHVPDHDSNDIPLREEGFEIDEDLPVKSLVQRPESMSLEVAAPNHQDQDASTKTKLKQPGQLGDSKPRERFERNFVDPAFAFSDEENLLPKRSKKTIRLSQPTRIASLSRPPVPDSNASQQRIDSEHGDYSEHESTTTAQNQAAARSRVEASRSKRAVSQRRPRGRPRAASRNSPPSSSSHSEARFGGPGSAEKSVSNRSHGYSDEEGVLHKTKKHGIRNSNPVLPEEGFPIPTGAAMRTSTCNEHADVESQTLESIAKAKKQKRRPMRVSGKPALAVESMANQDKTILSSTGTEQLASVNADRDMDLGLQDSSQRKETAQPMIEGETGISNSRMQKTARLSTDQSVLREDQKQLSPLAETQPAQPATPSRPRSKQGEKKTPFSSTSVMSLLSDSDDEEDELSFDISDFTPSGHHRILAHRPFPEPLTTPQFSTSSDKKKRASLVPNRSYSSGSHKISKPLRTPRSVGTNRVGHTSRKGKHRKSHQLARSVVRVVRRLGSDDGREGSILQTPGGTKRRCGENGWKCERDFCFVCME